MTIGDSQPDASTQQLKLALMPAKKAVTVSSGTVFVRRARAEDQTLIDGADPLQRGDLIIKRLVGRSEEKRDISGLANNDYELLTAEDREELARAVAEINEWNGSASASVQTIGELAQESIRKGHERRSKLFADAAASLDKSSMFQTLGLGKLHEEVEKLNSYRFLKDSTFDKLNQQLNQLDEARKALDLSMPKALTEHIENLKEREKAIFKSEPDMSRFRSIHIPRPEEAPLGKAALENARNTKKVLEKTEALVGIVAELSQTLIVQVLPQWIDEVKDNQAHATRALRWAIAALVAGVVATVGTAAWQVYVTVRIDETNSRSQKRAETLLHEQLSLQKQQLVDNAARAARLEDEVRALRKAASSCEGSIGCRCSLGLTLRDWEVPPYPAPQGAQPE